jgi:hypothetical protein
MNTMNKYLAESRFPKKAIDYNKIKNVDSFWDWNITDAKKAGGLRDLQPKTIADIIMWLNMAAGGWERTQGK